MKKEYKPISMRCNQEQFEAVKPKLEKSGIKFDTLGRFEIHVYLVNNYAGEDKVIGNNAQHNAENYNRKVYEQWDERIFLEACGVETIPTLEEVKEYFKDAEIVKSRRTGWQGIIDINTIRYDLYLPDFVICASSHKCGITTLFHPKDGYAKIITKKSPEYKITKEQLLELKGTVAEKWFPEVFKEDPNKEYPNEGDWYRGENGVLFRFIEEDDRFYKGYGITSDGNWQDDFREYLCTPIYSATEQEVTEALKKEAVKRGFVFRASINPIIDIENDKDIIFTTGSSFIFENNKLYVRGYGKFCIFKNGIWATVIPTKTKEEAEKLLNCKIL